VDGLVSPIGIVGALSVIDMGAEEPVIGATPIGDALAFFWSPDGESILTLSPRFGGGGRGLFLEIQVLDVSSGQASSYGAVRPAPAFVRGVVPFYDQYQRSVTPWSPDSSAFVINAIDQEGQPAAFVYRVGSEVDPTRIGGGVLPFWSPQ
jgi:hypothetical protein